jgi:hypothetical protein
MSIGCANVGAATAPSSEVITFALRFQAPPEASAGMGRLAAVAAISTTDPEAVDVQQFQVFVPTAG